MPMINQLIIYNPHCLTQGQCTFYYLISPQIIILHNKTLRRFSYFKLSETYVKGLVSHAA